MQVKEWRGRIWPQSFICFHICCFPCLLEDAGQSMEREEFGLSHSCCFQWEAGQYWGGLPILIFLFNFFFLYLCYIFCVFFSFWIHSYWFQYTEYTEVYSLHLIHICLIFSYLVHMLVRLANLPIYLSNAFSFSFIIFFGSLKVWLSTSWLVVLLANQPISYFPPHSLVILKPIICQFFQCCLLLQDSDWLALWQPSNYGLDYSMIFNVFLVE